MSSIKFVIGFYTIKCRGNITSNYKEIAGLLTENGYECMPFSEYPISRENLAKIDILVIPCPDNNKITPNEIKAIKTWVAQEGGGLLLLSHAGGDKGRRSNLSELSEKFGMIFENNQVLDKYTNMGVENLPLITNFSVPHPINHNLNKVCFRAGCSLTASGISATPVLISGHKADPFEAPLLLAGEDNEGRVVSVGSYEMFRDKITGGMRQEGHAQLALNIFGWLQTTRREQFRLGIPLTNNSAPYSEEEMGENGSPQQSSINSNVSSGRQNTTISPQMYESNVKILANEDLLVAFEQSLTGLYNFKQRVIQEFETIENNLARLMKAVLASEEDIIRFRTEQTNLSEDDLNTEGYSDDPDPEEEEVADLLSKISQVERENNEPSLDFTQELMQKFNQRSNSGPENQLTPMNSSIKPPVPPIVSRPVEKEIIQEPKTPEELEEERTNLQNKLNSIKNLHVFVEKKFATGKLNQKRYDKQIEKLETDAKETKKRIEQIEKLLNTK